MCAAAAAVQMMQNGWDFFFSSQRTYIYGDDFMYQTSFKAI
jgi:hypothetical protein